MGGGVRRFKRKFQKKKKTEAPEENGERRGYKDIIRDNEEFVKYYKSQNILPDEEWDRFMEYMRKDLPASFRISACSSAEAKRLLEIVQSDFFAKLVAPEEGGETPEIKNLLWYPNNMGWQLDLTRKDIRRFESYFRLHNFLMSETATGNISRQETVSMIPPLLLDIQPHHKVIDLCAAPGSKTAQLIETLHGDEAIAPGFVVANDLDNSRCYMLVHQAKRLSSPNCIITNHDASSMPNFMVPDKDGALKVLKYDRVLCDVPCTGDGTLRKNADIWVKWTPGHANNLYGIQNRILKRGLELLEVGGRLVYSTCSLNPVENEAVIFRMLFNAKGAVELINVSDQLKGLKYRPGMTKWIHTSKDQEQLMERAASSGYSTEECGLEKCIRLFPQDGNTGAFFVAVLVKKATLPWEAELRVGDDEKPKPKRPQKEKRRDVRGYREDPFVFFKGDEDIWKSMESFYALEGLDPKCLLTRCLVGKKRHIYMTSPAVKELVDLNQDKIKIINTGVKVFSRCDNKRMRCEFRLTQEGLFRIEAHIHARRIALPEKDLVTLLENHDPNNPPHITSFTEETQKLCEGVDEGSCVLDHDGTFKISIVGWRGGKSLRAYISKDDAMHYLRLFGVDTSRYDVNKFKKDDNASLTSDSKISSIDDKGDSGENSCEEDDKESKKLKTDGDSNKDIGAAIAVDSTENQNNSVG
ncbi:NOL1/NOP2/sun family [Nesidiocoris tenuis]|uniref:tRNA (cytosine(34)-C(5))-methyltransferase n=1 Tax=Nesidiocoris tenuis TaxID=355587 RepID=A0ABN7BE76_9HEMI|nr:NOL1/NOP2/sun family [Nesidiocoris tenuis]